MIEKIVSGGQTGVDRAALDAAIQMDIPCGGWCPQGRRAEDGPIPARYPLLETSWWGYPQRTRMNIRDSDGTLVLLVSKADRGTLLTLEIAKQLGKPCLALSLTAEPNPQLVHSWAAEHQVRILNVAGPRASSHPGIHARALTFLRAILSFSASKPVGKPLP